MSKIREVKKEKASNGTREESRKNIEKGNNSKSLLS